MALSEEGRPRPKPVVDVKMLETDTANIYQRVSGRDTARAILSQDVNVTHSETEKLSSEDGFSSGASKRNMTGSQQKLPKWLTTDVVLLGDAAILTPSRVVQPTTLNRLGGTTAGNTSVEGSVSGGAAGSNDSTDSVNKWDLENKLADTWAEYQEALSSGDDAAIAETSAYYIAAREAWADGGRPVSGAITATAAGVVDTRETATQTWYTDNQNVSWNVPREGVDASAGRGSNAVVGSGERVIWGQTDPSSSTWEPIPVDAVTGAQ